MSKLGFGIGGDLLLLLLLLHDLYSANFEDRVGGVVCSFHRYFTINFYGQKLLTINRVTFRKSAQP